MVTHYRPQGPSSLRTLALLIGFGFILFTSYHYYYYGTSAARPISTTYSYYSTFVTTMTTNGGGDGDKNSNSDNVDIDVTSALSVSARQTGTSPPKITFGVSNNSSRPLTALSWDTPLDPLALQLGHVTVYVSSSTAAGGGGGGGGEGGGGAGELERLELPVVKIRRKMPPGPDALVTVGPGETAENDVVLREALVPPEKLQELRARGARLFVGCRGRWATVWPGRAENVTERERGELSAGRRALTGAYQTELLEIEIGEADS